MRFGLLNRKIARKERIREEEVGGGNADQARIQSCPDSLDFGSNDPDFSRYSYDDFEEIGGEVANGNPGQYTWGWITCAETWGSAKLDSKKNPKKEGKTKKLDMKRGRKIQGLKEIESKAKTKEEEAYFSTGQISRLLGGIVSISTVSRMFDQGRFGGRVNPVTGRRQIAWQGVMEYLKERGLSEDKIALVEKRRGEEWTKLKRQTYEERKSLLTKPNK